MRKKPFAKLFCLMLALAVIFTMTAVTAFAEELPVDRATENGATVSEQVDTATNDDPRMGTTYYMYLAPDIVAANPPDMGVHGPSTDTLMLAAMIIGAAYLCVSGIAYSKKSEGRSSRRSAC